MSKIQVFFLDILLNFKDTALWCAHVLCLKYQDMSIQFFSVMRYLIVD